MRKFLAAVVICLTLGGCTAPPQVMVVHEKSKEYITAYQRNMTEIAITSVEAYEKSEKMRWDLKHKELLRTLASLDKDGKLRVDRALLATKMLLNKYEKVEDQVASAKVALAEANQDVASILAMHKAMSEYLTQSGLQPEHVAMLRGELDKSFDTYVETRRVAQIAKMQGAIEKLKARIAEGGEEFDAAAALGELKKNERAVELLKNLRFSDEEDSDEEDEEDPVLDELRKRIEEMLRARAEGEEPAAPEED